MYTLKKKYVSLALAQGWNLEAVVAIPQEGTVTGFKERRFCVTVFIDYNC